ncbi:TRAP transporter small permease [Ramlibacter sp. H39-3-26]|uniref:TRAP transporter small permease n=1 Tax=Curvibacter soli TaxID=3031331 RepID=UPI0023DBBFF9|nr:TRAP transporter small permease [Ramlibacter sp. H39-3-26]MDF1485733.1 TRAP transporter small permease [Ramlibacter sp. H39-3-26]
MRRILDCLYDGAAALAALCMVGLLIAVLTSIASRQLGVNVPGIDSYAGYLMAASGFLALASTLKRGEHIRVTLILGHLKGAAHRRLELAALFIALLLSLLFAWYSVRLVWQSYDFHDISTNNDATPLWLPQLSMAIGAVIFAIAFIDEFALELAGKRRQRDDGELLRTE